MSVRDRVWRSQHKSYLRPLPGRLGVTPRGKSQRLERVLTDFGCEHSFERAVGSVLEHYGFELGASAVRTGARGAAGFSIVFMGAHLFAGQNTGCPLRKTK